MQDQGVGPCVDMYVATFHRTLSGRSRLVCDEVVLEVWILLKQMLNASRNYLFQTIGLPAIGSPGELFGPGSDIPFVQVLVIRMPLILLLQD